MKITLKMLVEGRLTLSREQASATLQTMLASSPESDPEIAALLTALAVRGETAEELAGFASAMREARDLSASRMALGDDEQAALVDTCGTGGDGQGTFNISTGAALVAAAAGAKVAKHGNRAVTSKCGSADVLEALGVPIELNPERAVACLRETGFLFLLAPALHPAMRRVAGVRRVLGFRTIFNLAGPLTNPAGAEAQVMGVWAAAKVDLVGEAMRLLGVRHAFVVHGEADGGAGLDELTVTGTNHIAEVRRAGRAMGAVAAVAGAQPSAEVRRYALDPEEVGLTRAPLSALGGGGSAEESAGVLLAIFGGQERGPRREIVLLNAAAAVMAGELAADWREGLERARAAIDSGAVLRLLGQLRGFAGSVAR